DPEVLRAGAVDEAVARQEPVALDARDLGLRSFDRVQRHEPRKEVAVGRPRVDALGGFGRGLCGRLAAGSGDEPVPELNVIALLSRAIGELRTAFRRPLADRGDCLHRVAVLARIAGELLWGER